ncbi:hypothetical protein OB955_20760 [Halobacteria archaeon AArc-m2/3/4]|uniref:Uncharacterized protein n=1 Tax=Natronoglomus mannanivorans TaxID=2979990 RepID=A0AAP3E1V7_9EURY|nr:hypothetical protein [Halobacteria archaeon AArc-xg1-1]MCU4975135.1 hypothetical protein [Halobacteria archaeon AArc-m2/3/4]
MKQWQLVAVALALTVTGIYVLGIGPFDDSWEEPTPEITALEITDRGCEEDVRAFAHSSSGGTGSVNAGTLARPPETELSAEIRRTSPERAEITTYRLDIHTHEPDTTTTECPGRIAYRVEYDAPYDNTGTGLRVAVFVDGALRSCGSSTSGPDTGCIQLREDTDVHWTNSSDGSS